jgi:tetratricopeptide (TPR) repeat protein
MNTHRKGSPGRGRERRRTPVALTLALLFGALAGCDFMDPTNVENPRTTEEDLARAEEPVRALMPGLRAQFARMVGSQVVISEVTSDNYSVHGTGLSAIWDDPRSVSPTDMNSTGFATGIYWNTQEMRALGDFVLNEIAPGDEAATSGQLAEAHYYRGMAYLLQGENFTHVPTGRDTPPLPAGELLQLALADLEASTTLAPGGDFALPARAAIARAHRALGNSGPAVQAAQQVLGANPTFVFQQLFDGTTIENQPHIFLVVRQLKEMQPLPRLDFLDPKYLSREAGLAVAKAEEMHLILAEAELATGNLPAARAHLVDAIQLALNRGTTPFVDDDERLNADLSERPRRSDLLVAADPDSPPRAGLVLDRPGVEIQVPTISGTSLNPDSVLALEGVEETWHAFHLARQEILFLEGRRMSDMGIRLPIMLREIDQNAAIDPGSPGTVRVVPDYIPPNDQMNRFDPASPGPGDEVVTMRYDVNRALAQNQVSPFTN